MTRSITRLYESYERAREAAQALAAAGFPSADISLLSPRIEKDGPAETTPVETAATVGGVAGAGTGLLAALGVIAIPGFGPLLASGILATVIAGATGGVLAGSIVGSLIEYGVSEEEAGVYAESLRRGSSLVSVRVAEERAGMAEAILSRFEPVDTEVRRRELEQEAQSPPQQRTLGAP